MDAAIVYLIAVPVETHDVRDSLSQEALVMFNAGQLLSSKVKDLDGRRLSGSLKRQEAIR